MQVRLEVAQKKANVKRVTLKSDAVIGRSSDCNLRVASKQVSRRHCQLTLTDTGVLVRDLGSSNGTFVDGKQIQPEEQVPINPGSHLVVGPVTFVVRYDAPQPMTVDPPPDSTVELPVPSQWQAEAAAAEAPSAEEIQDDTTEPVEVAVSQHDETAADAEESPGAVENKVDEPGAVEVKEESAEELPIEEEEPALELDEAEQTDEAEQEIETDDEPLDEESEPTARQGRMRSLFGLLGRRKNKTADTEADEEVDDLEPEADEAEDESEQVAEAEETESEEIVSATDAEPQDLAADHEEQDAEKIAVPEADENGTDEDQAAAFLTQIDEDEEEPAADEETLGDFLNRLDE